MQSFLLVLYLLLSSANGIFYRNHSNEFQSSNIAALKTASDSKQADTNAGIGRLNLGVGCGSTLNYSFAFSTENIPRFSYHIANGLAQFLMIHFAEFNLPATDYIVIRDEYSPMQVIYYGNTTNGPFTTATFATKSVLIELYSTGSSTASPSSNCVGFQIDYYRFLAIPASLSSSKQEEVCGADESKEASCYRDMPTILKKADAVIRLLIQKNEGSFFCTGWLVGCQGHVLTNYHCISSQSHASNTDFEFGAQGSNCNQNCKSPYACKGTVRARSSKLIIANQELDFALVQIDKSIVNDYGYLTLRRTGAVLNERIYIPQHPGGFGKRIALKDGNEFGRVQTLTLGGCADDQVGYSLDTTGGASGSPVIGWSDQAVVALHHCGGCPNAAININKIVNQIQNLLPLCAFSDSVLKPAPTPAPQTRAPIPPQSPSAPTSNSRPISKAAVDGTLFSTSTKTTVDYVDFELSDTTAVELDILSIETASPIDSRAQIVGAVFADVNGDCNAGYIDSNLILFRLNDQNDMSRNTFIATNNDAPLGYGTKDGSINQGDSYMYLELAKGRYRLAIGTNPMTIEQAMNGNSLLSYTPRICDNSISNYGSYRLTISVNNNVNLGILGTSNSYIGNQCASSNTLRGYKNCPYHTEALPSRSITIDGTIQRLTSFVSVDYIPFRINRFGRILIEVSSYESTDGFNFMDINGDCESSYIDPVAYVFQRDRTNGVITSASNLVAITDDDEFISRRNNRRSISFRDPYISLALPQGEYVLVVGRYPLTIQDAINRVSTASVSAFTPETCGKTSTRGNYMVTMSSTFDLTATAPGTFTGRKCPNNVGQMVCSN